MRDPFQTLSVRGNRWPENRRMHVMLYPNTPAVAGACRAGATVPSAVEYAADQLTDAGTASYYRLARFPAERDDYRYPRVGRDELRTGFRDFLRGTTEEFSDASWCARGDCRDLRAYRGVHLLVHDYGLGVGLADAVDDDCAGNGGTGFSRGAAAWTGVDDGSGPGLTSNSAIHETLHLFVRVGADGVRELLCDADDDGEVSGYEEHTLGRLDSTGAVTPMLTYHVDEHAGCGDSALFWDGSYAQELTGRTKAAVRRTALDQCRPQPGVSKRADRRS